MPTIVYTDLDLNFLASPITGDVTQNTGNLAVIRAIENLVQLKHYEYPFRPPIGSNVEKLLFETISDIVANAIAKEITNLLNNYEPRATNYFVKATPNTDQNGYELHIEFFINNSVVPIAISMFLERIS